MTMQYSVLQGGLFHCSKVASLHFCICFRMNTDVHFGKQNGLKTILTFTGITQQSELASAPQEWIPDYFCKSLGDLLVCKY